MNTHTPGPWKAEWTNDVGPDDDYYVEFYEILDAKGNRVGTAEEKHDAVLMAEAPKLLEALKISLEVLEKVDPYKGQEDLLIDVVLMNKEIIAKATGEQA